MEEDTGCLPWPLPLRTFTCVLTFKHMYTHIINKFFFEDGGDREIAG